MASERHPPQHMASAGACAFVLQDVAFSWANCSKQEKQVAHEKGNKACPMCSVFEVEVPSLHHSGSKGQLAPIGVCSWSVLVFKKQINNASQFPK